MVWDVVVQPSPASSFLSIRLEAASLLLVTEQVHATLAEGRSGWDVVVQPSPASSFLSIRLEAASLLLVTEQVHATLAEGRSGWDVVVQPENDATQPNPASSFLAASLPAACHPSRCMQPWRRVGLGRCRATQPSILLPFSWTGGCQLACCLSPPIFYFEVRACHPTHRCMQPWRGGWVRVGRCRAVQPENAVN